jgi:hypothetical protein
MIQMDESSPQLEIIPLASLVEHEWHDDQRTSPAIEGEEI